MIGPSAIAIGAIIGVLVHEAIASGAADYIAAYFDKPTNKQMYVLPEYEIERHVCPATLPSHFENPANPYYGSATKSSNTILYRIPGGPKSPKAQGKRATFIQYGILCDVNLCTVNKLHIATVYLLVDQGYDVWLGLNNFSMTDTLISYARSIIERLWLQELFMHRTIANTNTHTLLQI